MKYSILLILFAGVITLHALSFYAFADTIPFTANDLFMGTNGGKVFHYSQAGSLLDTLQTDAPSIATPLCFDTSRNLLVANSVTNTVTVFSSQGIKSTLSWGGPYAGLPTGCVTDKSGNFYIYTSEIEGPINQIRKFTATGTLIASYSPEYDITNTGTSFSKGLYSIALGNDDCSMFYTAVQSLSKTTGAIKRFNVCTGTQLTDFAKLPTPSCTDIKVRLNSDVLVACGKDIYLLDGAGKLIKTYTPKDNELMQSGQVSYSLDLDPDTMTFWAGGNFSGNVYRISLASGAGHEQKVFSIPVATPSWNTIIGLTVHPEQNSTLPPVISIPQPFLDLPWDYKKDNTEFEAIALNPFSWFDHQYPLQNTCCEPPVLIYTGELVTDYYRSHSGYDYALQNGIHLNTPVLATAAGFASFVPENKSAGGGNVIKINHGNGYQTWYEHLSSDNLIVTTEGKQVFVSQGQQIGKVGMTGNTTGPHIHLSVFKDANGNGSFVDDYPYGLVDPLGWEARVPDPWTQYHNGGKQGEASYNLFTARAEPIIAAIPVTGGTLLAHDADVQVIVPPNASSAPFMLFYRDGPFSSFMLNGRSFISLAPSFFLEATITGDILTQFKKPITIMYRYSGTNYFSIKESNLLIYYLNEQSNKWEALPSRVDTEEKTVTAETSHLSHFALMGEKKDTTAPTTEIALQGLNGQVDWYRSNVNISLSAKDNEGGLGVEDLLYQVDDGQWQEYSKPFILEKEGEHTVSYFARDTVDNREAKKTKRFFIDKTAPEAIINYDISTLDVIVRGEDSLSTVQEKKSSLLSTILTITDNAGNTLKIEAKKRKAGNQVSFSIDSLQYNQARVMHVASNLFFTLVEKDTKNSVKTLDQYFTVNGDKQVYTNYTERLAKTMVYIKSSGNKFVKKEKLGLSLVQVITKNGGIRYKL